MSAEIKLGDVVTIHERGDQDDRASGRVVRLLDMYGVGHAQVDLGNGRLRDIPLWSLVRFGLERGDDAAPWAPGQAVILLDSYDNGVQAGQLGRVVEVIEGLSAVPVIWLAIRARGPKGYITGRVRADRVYRIPS